MPNVVTQLIVCFIAGIGAGLGTGFAGMSAAAVISPMLITFLNMDAYQAVLGRIVEFLPHCCSSFWMNNERPGSVSRV